ncbi:putative coatomer subunit zeta [Diplonema papillatum]|nr:putative coatomer subunit zeta [Diplonema papillatum]|eukprot:gene9115-14121_t
MAELLHKIQAIVILDDAGKRIFSKYWGEPFEGKGKLEKQMSFEQKLYTATHAKGSRPAAKDGGDITLVDAKTVVFRLDEQVYFYVVGALQENEMVITSVLCCLYETLSSLLKSQNTIYKRQLLENFDLLVLTVDEMIDDGIILQATSAEVYQLVFEHAADANDAVSRIKTAINNAHQRGR